MIYNLVRNLSIVLKHIVVLDALRKRDFLGYREHFVQVLVGDVVEFCAVEFRDDELCNPLLAIVLLIRGRAQKIV